MIRGLAFFAFLAAVIAAATWLANNPGAVTAEWRGYRIETSLAVVWVGVALACVAAALAYRLWWGLKSLPRRAAERWRDGRRRKGTHALTHSMVALAAGESREAERAARRAAALLAETPIAWLLSAQAAQLRGDDRAAEASFAAMLENPETVFLGLRGLIGLALRAGQADEALSLIERALGLRPKTPWLLSVLLDLHARAGRWRAAQEVLHRARRAGAVDGAEEDRKTAVLLVEQSRASAAAGEGEEALAAAEKAHKRDRALTSAAVTLAGLLSAAGHPRRARNVIHRSWKASPHPDLAAAYLRIGPDSDPLARVGRLEKLLTFNPDHAESHLSLARAALDARIWGAARKHLSAVTAAPPPRRQCLMMAELEEKESGDLAAAREWLASAAQSLADPVWVCGACGGTAASWTSLCGRCGAVAAITWDILGRRPLSPGEAAVAAPPPNDGPYAAQAAIGAPPNS